MFEFDLFGHDLKLTFLSKIIIFFYPGIIYELWANVLINSKAIRIHINPLQSATHFCQILSNSVKFCQKSKSNWNISKLLP
jgi:hypothetical protein